MSSNSGDPRIGGFWHQPSTSPTLALPIDSIQRNPHSEQCSQPACYPASVGQTRRSQQYHRAAEGWHAVTPVPPTSIDAQRVDETQRRREENDARPEHLPGIPSATSEDEVVAEQTQSLSPERRYPRFRQTAGTEGEQTA